MVPATETSAPRLADRKRCTSTDISEKMAPMCEDTTGPPREAEVVDGANYFCPSHLTTAEQRLQIVPMSRVRNKMPGPDFLARTGRKSSRIAECSDRNGFQAWQDLPSEDARSGNIRVFHLPRCVEGVLAERVDPMFLFRLSTTPLVMPECTKHCLCLHPF